MSKTNNFRFTLAFICILLLQKVIFALRDHDILILREETRDAFLHSYNSYLSHGFPHDEVMPLSCKARRYDQRIRGDLDDVLGGYMLTLIDSLDSLIVMREFDRFRDALKRLNGLNFDRDLEVSVFEANIRVLGGLLSAHQLALLTLPESEYDGVTLLNHARNLGDKLLPAFATLTGIPVHRVNLLHGKSLQESTQTCTAAGGTFLLEMGLLSRLTGDPTYERTAYKALRALWDRRSSLGLVGALIDTHSGAWIHTHTGIGAGIDSFYETLLKSHILLGDANLLEWFDEAYDAVQMHTNHKGLNLEVSMEKGAVELRSSFVSSLQAFWPALQILAGHVTSAKSTFSHLLSIWNKYKALPDIYDANTGSTHTYSRDYPLRPEMMESAYHLFSATRDEQYLNFGRDSLWALQNITRAPCGYASIADVNTGRLDDRMDSYFLAETLKYLFLLFDEALPVHMRCSIFCTSGYRSQTVDRSGSSNQDRLHSAADVCHDSDNNLRGDMRISRTIRENNTVENVNSASSRHKRVCISRLHSLFSTEGHLFMIESELRPLSSKDSNTTKTNAVCQL